MPVTFYIEVADASKESNYAASMQPFYNFYNSLEQNKKNLQELNQRFMHQL
jgi:hypothetical protein